MSELIGDVLERKRGDTAPDKITVILDGGIDLFSYKMTLNRERNPEDDTAQLSEHTGVVVSTLTGGTVTFPWDATQADQEPDKYWYDIQQTDANGKILTIAKNKYIFY